MTLNFGIYFYCITLILISKSLDCEGKRKNANEKVCEGTSDKLSYTVRDSRSKYQSYVAHYKNCTIVSTNLEITFLEMHNATANETFDMSFLESIEEVYGYVLIAYNHVDVIPLTNLRVIHGRYLYGANSLFVADNFRSNRTDLGLTEIRLNSLHEIVHGSVFFNRNPLLCYLDSIHWNDILSNPESTVHISNIVSEIPSRCQLPCNDSCYQNLTGSTHCWGPGEENCQQFHRLTCSENCYGNCYGPEPGQCCSPECAGGCLEDKSKCVTCRNFIDGDACVSACPSYKIYNMQTFTWQSNPKAKYTFKNLCVDKCPDNMYVREGACVTICGEGYAPSETNGKDCVPCGDACPKNCTGGIVTSRNIRTYENCTIIQGHLKFLSHSFNGDETGLAPLNITDLQVFETVEYITECLQIELSNEDLTSLSFFKNLKKILGHKLCGKYALKVVETKLQTLGLESLESIEQGMAVVWNNHELEQLGLTSLKSVAKNFRLLNNTNLCYYRSLNWTALGKLDERNNAQEEYCIEQNKTCSDQCEGGCWGAGEDQCASCAAYRFERKCLATCDDLPGLYTVNDTERRLCMRCDSECSSGCTGKGSDSCHICRNVKDGPYCVNQCPGSKYADKQRQCRLCSPTCMTEDEQHGGCTGESNSQGPGGCNACQKYLEIENNRYECHAENFTCPDGYYEQLMPAPKEVRSGKGRGIVVACKKCHPDCKICVSGTECQECKNYKEENLCVTNCSRDRYVDPILKRCYPCDPLCIQCSGPTKYDCLRCMFYKVYVVDNPGGALLTPSDNKTDGENKQVIDWSEMTIISFNRTHTSDQFSCEEECPESAPAIITETKNNFVEHVCTTTSKAAEASTRHSSSDKTDIYISVGTVMGGVVAVACAVFIITSFRRRRRKEMERKTAELLGIRSLEASSPSNYRPDLSSLRLIKETELTRGQAIGSGAFGTVYQGIWTPSGERLKIPVAIKVLQKGPNIAELNTELLDEARIMATVRHENCIRNLAVCLTAELMLITQLMPNGSLLEYVRKYQERIGSNALLTWSKQIASGMQYLEKLGIVHRDLAARNVLVEGPQMVKITDFGLAKLVYDKEEYQATGGKVPIKWLALESIQHRVFTHRSDVWSYGVTLWEIFTYGLKPYDNVSARDLCDLLEKGERLPQPQICTIDVYMIMIKCWMVDAQSRPSFKELVDVFSSFSKDPGRYLVIQEEDRMQLPSTEQNLREMLRGLSVLDEADRDQVITAEDYLRPHDLLLDHLAMTNSGVDYKNVSDGAGDSGSPTLSPVDCKYLSDLESSFASRNGKDVDRQPSQRYFTVPSKDQKLTKMNSYTSDGGKNNPKQVQYSEVKGRNAMDEDDYLRPLSTAGKRPKYIDLMGSNSPDLDYQNDSGHLDYVNSRSEKTASVQNPEYFQHRLPGQFPA